MSLTKLKSIPNNSTNNYKLFLIFFVNLIEIVNQSHNAHIFNSQGNWEARLSVSRYVLETRNQGVFFLNRCFLPLFLFFCFDFDLVS